MKRMVKLSEKLSKAAKVSSKLSLRSTFDQIEHWIKIGKTTEENPSMSLNEINDLIRAKDQAVAGLISEYKFEI